MGNQSGNQSPYRIGSLERALLVVDTLAEVPDASVAELAQLLGVAKGSLFRHLKVLEANGYVLQSPGTKRYSLGPRLLYLGHAARQQLRLPEVAAPLMTALRDRFNETVHMGVLSRGEVVHVEVAPSAHPVKMAAEVGDRTWAHVSGLGKVLLAWGGDDAVEFVLRERGLPSLTDRTIVERAALEAADALARGDHARAAELYAEIGSAPDEGYARLRLGRALVRMRSSEKLAADD